MTDLGDGTAASAPPSPGPTPAPEPAPPSPAQPSRPPEIKAARIAAAAALVGALVGAIGAGLPALITSSNQIAAAEKLSSDAFLRDQRRAAYAQLIQADQELQRVEQDCSNEIFGADGFAHPPPTAEDIQHIQPKLDVAYAKVRDAAANVQPVGSEEAAQLAMDLARYQSHAVANMTSGPSDSVYAPGSRSLEEIQADLSRSYSTYQAFVAAARTDLLPA